MINFLKDAIAAVIVVSTIAVMLCVFFGVVFGLTELAVYLSK